MEEKIKLTNNEIYFFANMGSPGRKSLDKLQALITVSGKTQYWVYKVWKHIISTAEDVEKVRMELIKRYCTKDEKGEPVLIKNEEKPTMSQFSFSEENTATYNKEFVSLMNAINEFPMNKIVIDSTLLERMNKDQPVGNIITGGDMFTLEKIFDFVE